MMNGGVFVVFFEEVKILLYYLLEGIEWRGFGDFCKVIVFFFVILIIGSEVVVGFIVMGVNF